MSDEKIELEVASEVNEEQKVDESTPPNNIGEESDKGESLVIEYSIPETIAKIEDLKPSKKQEIALSDLDADALWIVRRLRAKGHEAYLTGGCVRDLLLGLTPKDFDVATAARPEVVHKIFRNCRLIGRRFRLAHITFDFNKVIETATFRSTPHDESSADEDGVEDAEATSAEAADEAGGSVDMDDNQSESTDTEVAPGDDTKSAEELYVDRDNNFGTVEEDALRRDLTINGLFYDPIAGRVIDFVDGRKDLESRQVRTIGPARRRFMEDPVRILRAIKFATRLDFNVEDETASAMAECADLLTKCAPARLHEEILKLFLSGYGAQTFDMMDEYGVLTTLMPELLDSLDWEASTKARKAANVQGSDLHQYLTPAKRRAQLKHLLKSLDEVKAFDTEIPSVVLFATLLMPSFSAKIAGGEDALEWLEEVSEAWVQRFRLTRRDKELLRHIMKNIHLFAAEHRGGARVKDLVMRSWFKSALMVFTLLCQTGFESLDSVRSWKGIARASRRGYRQSRQSHAVRETRQYRAAS